MVILCTATYDIPLVGGIRQHVGFSANTCCVYNYAAIAPAITYTRSLPSVLFSTAILQCDEFHYEELQRRVQIYQKEKFVQLTPTEIKGRLRRLVATPTQHLDGRRSHPSRAHMRVVAGWTTTR